MKFQGIVKKHLGRGKELGFPTANIDAPAEISDGLYLAWTAVLPDAAQRYESLAFIGSNETFGEKERAAEIHILDFDGELYGKTIEVEIIQKLRPVVKFSSQNTLIQQMHNDVAEARRLFKKLLE